MRPQRGRPKNNKSSSKSGPTKGFPRRPRKQDNFKNLGPPKARGKGKPERPTQKFESKAVNSGFKDFERSSEPRKSFQKNPRYQEARGSRSFGPPRKPRQPGEDFKKKPEFKKPVFAEPKENTESEVIVGINQVIEALNSSTGINKVVVRKNIRFNNGLNTIFEECKQKGIRFDQVSDEQFERLPGRPRDVVAYVSPIEYLDIENIIKSCKKEALVVILDGIEDPHNLGAIIRTAECFGACGIVIPKHQACPVTSTVLQTSAGAATRINIARVSNLNHAIEKLKEAGFWIYGTDPDAKQNLSETKFPERTAVIIGSEGSGIRQLVAQNCDVMIKIPMFGQTGSLNASVCSGVILYEISRGNANNKIGEG